MKAPLFAFALAATLGLSAAADAQVSPGQPGRAQHNTVTGHPPGGTSGSGTGPAQTGANSGNTAAQPQSQRGRSSDPGERSTEAPSLEQRVVPPGQRPDQQMRR
jgi:hypothetical protein